MKVNKGDPTLVDLFADDVQIHFPKFGVGRGKASLGEFARRMQRHLISIAHHMDAFKYVIGDRAIVVEGTEYGQMRDGRSWPDHEVSEGRFCSVFEFDGLQITRMFIYVDPDFCSDDRDRVKWLREPTDDALERAP